MSEIYLNRQGRILRLHTLKDDISAMFTDIADGSRSLCFFHDLIEAEPPEWPRTRVQALQPDYALSLRGYVVRQPYRLFNGPGSIRFVLTECLRLGLCALLVGLFSLLLIGFMP